jgi:hypothetical protein
MADISDNLTNVPTAVVNTNESLRMAMVFAKDAVPQIILFD